MYSSARRFMALAAFFCVAVSGQKLTFNNGKGICHFVQDAAGTSVISDCDMEVKSVGLKSLYDRVVTIEGKMVKLEQRIKANEDDLDLSNAGALTNMEARVTKIKKDVHETPLLHHAFGAHTCVDGQVNKETRQCVCNTGGNGFLNRYGGGSYQSGEKYEACTQCDNRVCKSTLFAEQYRTGACSTAAGNNFNCVDCPNSACSSSQWPRASAAQPLTATVRWNCFRRPLTASRATTARRRADLECRAMPRFSGWMVTAEASRTPLRAKTAPTKSARATRTRMALAESSPAPA
jgi:hypothetical protein